MRTPVDATATPAWAELARLHDDLNVDFRAWFADDPDRAQRFSLAAADLYADLSKNYLTDEIKDALVRLAEQVAGLTGSRSWGGSRAGRSLRSPTRWSS